MSDPTRTRAAATASFADPDLTKPVGPTIETADAPASPPGYEMLNEVGQGGMGVVYRARERQFDRFVAVKVLHPRYLPDSPSARRFLDEARITAQLQHPGIPPVHHVGALSDGRPFLSMKLIQGDTLDKLLAGREPSRPETGRWLGVFEGICQAVGFAHTNGVIHRDLKPGNVMVGAFGEVQVMDWGLAKNISGTKSQTPSSVPAATNADENADAAHTQAGSILGTPSYMAPEQARGETERIDPRSDVFSLGAILCELLTGQTPLAGSTKSVRELIARLAVGDLGDVMQRLDASGADAELVALAKRCLAVDPADRPTDAHELATALAEYRASVEARLRTAEVERAKAEEEKRRQRMKTRFIGGITVLLLVVSGLVWWVYESSRRTRDQQIQQESEKARTLSSAVAEANLLREQGLKQTDDPATWKQSLTLARASLKAAEEQAVKTGWFNPELTQPYWSSLPEFTRDDNDCELLLELDRLPELNEIGLFSGYPMTNTVSNRYAAAFRKVGFDLEKMTDEEALAWLRKHRFRDRLTLALRDWVQAMPFQPQIPERTYGEEFAAVISTVGQRPEPMESQQDRLRRLVNEASDKFTRDWWLAVQAGNWDQSLNKLAKQPEVANLSSRQLASLASGLSDYRVSSDPQLQYDFLQQAYLRFPAEFWTNFRLAKFYADRPQWKSPDGGTALGEALRHCTAAVAAKPNSAFPRVVLAMHLLNTNRKPAVAEALLKNAIAVDPNSPWPYLVLGGLEAMRNRWDEAIERFVAGVRTDPEVGLALVNGFTIPIRAPNSERMMEVFDRLVGEFPDQPDPWLLRAERRQEKGDGRGQLADLREAAKKPALATHPKRLIVELGLKELEKLAAWEKRLPEALAGGPAPSPDEWVDAARYCAKFDKNYSRAAECADRALAGESRTINRELFRVAEFAEWAMMASDQPGLADEERARYRRLALRWLRECAERQTKPFPQQQWNVFVVLKPAFRRYSNPTELKQRPADEQAEWDRFVRKSGYGPKDK